MAKAVDQTVLDAMLDEALTADELYVCNAEPADGADVTINAVKLHNTAVTASLFSAKEAGAEADSRQYRILAQTGVTLDNVAGGGEAATHVATRDGVTKVLKTVTTINGGTGVNVDDNDVVDIGEYIHKILQPT